MSGVEMILRRAGGNGVGPGSACGLEEKIMTYDVWTGVVSYPWNVLSNTSNVVVCHEKPQAHEEVHYHNLFC